MLKSPSTPSPGSATNPSPRPQHVVFGICRLIDILVPDVPQSLELKMKRERYLAKQALADSDAIMQVSVAKALLADAASLSQVSGREIRANAGRHPRVSSAGGACMLSCCSCRGLYVVSRVRTDRHVHTDRHNGAYVHA